MRWIGTCFLALAWLASLQAAHAWPPDRNLVGYYPSWAVYGRDYHVPDIPAERVNIINYAFANLAGGEIVLGDPYADTEKWYPGDSWHPDSLRGSFHRLQILKRQHPHVRTLISVGGWTWSTYFSDVALTPASRARFAASCVAFVQRYEFDGVDIDWEYPVSGGHPGNVYRPEDRENYTLLLAELRGQLSAAGDYLLTIAAPASPLVIPNIEVELIHPYLDWINIMTYDFHGPWGGDFDEVTNFNAPLHPASDDPTPEPAHSAFNLAAAVETYLVLGVPRAKLNPGLAFYGRGYGLVQDQNDGLFAGYQGPAWNGTWEAGVFDFWDLRQHYIDLSGYASHRHAEAQVPWLFNPGARVMISYDDPISIAAKGHYINSQMLGGAMFWEFSADRDAELLETIHAVVIAGGGSVPAESGSGDRGASVRVLSGQPCVPGRPLRIALGRPAPSQGAVMIFDPGGTWVRTLEPDLGGPGTTVGACTCTYTYTWDGRGAGGRPLPSGAYFIALCEAGRAGAARVVLVR